MRQTDDSEDAAGAGGARAGDLSRRSGLGAPSAIEWQLLGLMGVSLADRLQALDAVADPAEGLAEALMRMGALDEKGWWFALAYRLQITPLDTLDLAPAPAHRPIPAADIDLRLACVWDVGPDTSRLIIAPRGAGIDAAAVFLARKPELRGRVALASPRALRAGLRDRHALGLARTAIEGLRQMHPDMSASWPVGLGTVALATAIVLAVPVCMAAGLIWPLAPLLACFAVLGLVRLAAALSLRRAPPAQALPDKDLPSYAVLVPLFREEAVVPDLVEGLLRLDYPPDRLDIRLVVEGDDAATRAACDHAVQGTTIDVVVVPPSRPRTKPKALSYALQLVDADLVAVFDAEDLPEPGQLREAAASFAAGGDDLACVQAIIEIDHDPAHQTWLSRQFALEYRMLFRGLLPWLGRHFGWFPIGGTSNHFRLDWLRAAGGWDPYNVTEDADIAVRLARHGGRFATISASTWEEAPMTLGVWLPQRSRWLKGWMQTWLVHMRAPFRLWRDLGVLRFLLFQVVIAGQIISAFLFPVGLAALALTGLAAVLGLLGPDGTGGVQRLATLMVFVLGWIGAALLALRTRHGTPMLKLLADVLTLPAYWALLAVAATRAAIDLVRNPHRWSKTPHGRARRKP